MSRNYKFHIPKTNLASRTDNLTGQSESFLYDNLDRLTKCYTPIKNIAYATNGNISSKTEGGTYAYDATKVHAVTSVTKTPGTASQPLQDISYTKFNKADVITQKTTVTQKTLTYAITYGPDQQRVKTIFTDTSGYKTIRYYSGSYQKDSIVVGSTKTVKKIHYIMGGTGLVAVYIKWSTGQDSMFYVCKDRQGSIVALVKQNGTVSERFSYDAWGRRRNPANWADYNVPAPRLINRGYTGHEMLDGFGLINMNGRMYDPVIGRVLSPDNYVQDPTNTQSYNRYSYCLNNPLRYTDPSGWFAAAADQYWNMGKEITDFITFSGRRASSMDGTGGGGGWGGVGGALPAWFGTGDYGAFWRQLLTTANNMLSMMPDNIVFSLSDVSYKDGNFNFTWSYNTKASEYTQKLGEEIEKLNENIENRIESILAARSNRGYGKSFVDPGPGDDDPIYGEIYSLKGACFSWKYNFFGAQLGISIAWKCQKSSFTFGNNGTQYQSTISSDFGVNYEGIGFNLEYDHSNMNWSNELSMGPLVFNKSGMFFRPYGGEIGIGSVFGSKLYYRLGDTGPRINYQTPLIPSDKTNRVNPYKIY